MLFLYCHRVFQHSLDLNFYKRKGKKLKSNMSYFKNYSRHGRDYQPLKEKAQEMDVQVMNSDGLSVFEGHFFSYLI